MKKYYRFEIDTLIGSIVSYALLFLFGITAIFIDFSKIDDYVQLVKRTKQELKKWIKKVGEQKVRTKAGIK